MTPIAITAPGPVPSQASLSILATLFAAILAVLPTPANAQNFENLERLDSLVALSVGAHRGEPGGPVAPIDRRLRLAACPQTPAVEAPRLGAATVSCASLGWRIRVPLVPLPQVENAQLSSGFVPAGERAPAVAVVKKGDPVQLIAGNASFSVSRFMIADEDGTVGSLIRVRQDPRATPVFARVEALGVVRIPGI